MNCIIVTGGAGFIGSNFVRLVLAETDVRVVVFDKLTYAGHRENLEEIADHERLRLVVGDICDRELVDELLREERPTAIVNFAAESHVDRSIDGPADFLRTNVVGAFTLLEATRAYLTRGSEELSSTLRFLHVSTDEVYGSLGSQGKFREDDPYAPNSPYAASKAAADHFVRAYHRTYGLPTIVTNCSNNYGPYQFPEKLIPLMILNATEGRPLPVYGDGEQVRDWIYVEDHCRGVLDALCRGEVGERYLIGAEEERTNLETVHAICDVLERLAPADENPAMRALDAESYRGLVEHVRDRPGHDRRYAIDASKTRQALGWEPRHDFEAGLQKTVRWYLEHRDWVERVRGRYAGERLGLRQETA